MLSLNGIQTRTIDPALNERQHPDARSDRGMTVTDHLEPVPAARYRDLVRFHIAIPQLDGDRFDDGVVHPRAYPAQCCVGHRDGGRRQPCGVHALGYPTAASHPRRGSTSPVRS
jgi:hypothetical protein